MQGTNCCRTRLHPATPRVLAQAWTLRGTKPGFNITFLFIIDQRAYKVGQEAFKSHARVASWVLPNRGDPFLKYVKHIHDAVLVCSFVRHYSGECRTKLTKGHFSAFQSEALPTTPGGTGHDHQCKVVWTRLENVHGHRTLVCP
jgi:hypothetical protein